MIKNKQEIRKSLIAKRRMIPSQIAQVATQSLTENLLRIIPCGVRVAGYCSIRGEINVNYVLEKLQELGSKIALPVVIPSSNILKFFCYTSNTPLIIGRFGVPHPQSDLPEIIPDVVLVPMVGFDIAGNRLGYGGGYYDATIHYLRKENKQVQIIGVAYKMQELEWIPIEAHDERMDMVATEDGVYRMIEKE